MLTYRAKTTLDVFDTIACFVTSHARETERWEKITTYGWSGTFPVPSICTG